MSPLDDIVVGWLARADDDLRLAMLGLTARPPVHWGVAFHAQQAAEKLLKAFLTFHVIEYAKSHNIDYLLDLCEDLDKQFATLRPAASKLTDYAVQTRCPFPTMETTEAQAREAVEIAKQVRGVVSAAMPDRFFAQR